jgi:hypothetical protein
MTGDSQKLNDQQQLLHSLYPVIWNLYFATLYTHIMKHYKLNMGCEIMCMVRLIVCYLGIFVKYLHDICSGFIEANNIRQRAAAIHHQQLLVSATMSNVI